MLPKNATFILALQNTYLRACITDENYYKLTYDRMKKIITLALLAASALGAGASTTHNFRGVDYQVDTLFHNQVGPSTTQTSLWLHNDDRVLRVFYCTMDMTDTYLSLGGVCATDKVAGNETISGMAKRKSKPGNRYFIGVNGDFFYTSGRNVRNVSVVGTPVGSTVVEGEIYKTRNGATNYKQLIVDKAGNCYIDPFTFGGTVTKTDGTTAALGAVNDWASNASNKITLYTPRYYGSSSEVGTGTEILAKLAPGETFNAGAPFRLVAVGEPSTAGDMTIDSATFVIHGHGTTASFVAGLKDGDVVTVTPTWTANGITVNPYEVVSGNPKILAGGEVLESEGDRGDASSNQPRAAIGFADGGKKVVFMVVDGRSALSYGVRTTLLADIMRYAGATDAMNMDGGGSAVLYTSALGNRNKPSDGTERADGNGFYVKYSCPDDSTLASIRFIDYKLETPKYGIYTPHFYGYNRYGVLIDPDVKGVRLSCPESIGFIKNDTTFIGSGNGCQLLTATIGSISVQKLMTVDGNVDSVLMANKSVINDTYRNYTVEVNSYIGGEATQIDPSALTWSSSDQSVVGIDANTGVLRGVADGTATVTGRVGSFSADMQVTVQRPVARVMAVDPNPDASTWSTSQSGGKNGTLAAAGDGLVYTYTGASARVPKITLTKQLVLWSLPDTLRLRINPGDATVKSVTLSLRAGSNKVAYQTVTDTALTSNAENVIDLATSAWTDATAMSSYPITLNNIQLSMGSCTTGQEYKVQLLGLETVYDAVPVSGIGSVDSDARQAITINGTTLLFGSAVDCVDVYDVAGRLVASANGVAQLSLPTQGIYVVAVKTAGRTVVAKVKL